MVSFRFLPTFSCFCSVQFHLVYGVIVLPDHPLFGCWASFGGLLFFFWVPLDSGLFVGSPCHGIPESTKTGESDSVALH